jgi:hypothetical protein
MRKVHFVVSCLLMWLALASIAEAAKYEDYLFKDINPQPYADWTLEQIKADPAFIPWDKFDHVTAHGVLAQPSSARDTSKPGWPAAYNWIGCIELPQGYLGRYAVVVFDSTGSGITMVADCDHGSFELMPIWFGRTIDYLFDVGIFAGCG